MKPTTLENVEKELQRVNKALEETVEPLRSAKAAHASASSPDEKRKAFAEMDGLYKLRETLKADRVALWATKDALQEQAGA